jgi:hypothetical protein
LLSFAPMQANHIEAVESTGARYLGQLEPFHLKRSRRTIGQLRSLRKPFAPKRLISCIRISQQ